MELTEHITNVLLQRPIGFVLGEKHYCLYPMTLGKSQFISRLLRDMNMDNNNIDINAPLELARVIGEHKEEALRIIAYSMLPGRECLLEEKVLHILSELRKNAEADDIVTLASVVINKRGIDDILHYYSIDKELAEYKRICKEKDDQGSYNFCGCSIYGSMISPLAEKYGWTLDYILWEISLDNIQLLLADAQKTVFLNVDERKRIHPKQANNVIKVDDPNNRDMILNMNWD